LVSRQTTAHLLKHFAIKTKLKAKSLRQRFDIADIIIKTEMVIKRKIKKNKNTNLNP